MWSINRRPAQSGLTWPGLIGLGLGALLMLGGCDAGSTVAAAKLQAQQAEQAQKQMQQLQQQIDQATAQSNKRLEQADEALK